MWKMGTCRKLGSLLTQCHAQKGGDEGGIDFPLLCDEHSIDFEEGSEGQMGRHDGTTCGIMLPYNVVTICPICPGVVRYYFTAFRGLLLEQLNTRVVSACRPIRIAFLVEDQGDTANTAAMFDAIFADCFSRWGGRFNLIIPTSAENGPMPDYVPWLRFYDPDIIYSYVELSADLVIKLHEDLSPIVLIATEK